MSKSDKHPGPHYEMRTPCANCPFLKAGRGGIHLRRERRAEIAKGLEITPFSCHKTVDYSQATNPGKTERSAHCAGALIFMRKTGRMSIVAALAQSLGFYDDRQLDMSAPVVDTLEEFVGE